MDLCWTDISVWAIISSPFSMLSWGNVPHDWFSKVNKTLKKLTNIWFTLQSVFTLQAKVMSEFCLYATHVCFLRQSEQNNLSHVTFVQSVLPNQIHGLCVTIRSQVWTYIDFVDFRAWEMVIWKLKYTPIQNCCGSKITKTTTAQTTGGTGQAIEPQMKEVRKQGE